MKFLIIDNYDSFVYNIAQRLGELGINSDVVRNDKITIDEIKKGDYNAIIISHIYGCVNSLHCYPRRRNELLSAN